MPAPQATDVSEVDVLGATRVAAHNAVMAATTANTFMMNMMHGIFLTGQQLVGAKAAQELAISAQAREVLQGNAAANAPRETQPGAVYVPPVVKAT